MSTDTSTLQALLRQGTAALQAGNAATAREAFGRLTGLEARSIEGWLGLAFACARLGDDAATLQAVDRALELEPRNPRALLFKADHFAATRRERAAVNFYEAALRVSAGVDNPPADIARGLQRARTAVARFAADTERRLFDGLARAGYDPLTASPRFRDSLEISLGRKQVYHQGPTRYYFPGLPQRQFYERGEFAWTGALESATSAIRAELQAVLADDRHFVPYLQSSADAPVLNDRSLLDNPDWSACYLLRDGALQPAGARCPATLAALDPVPLPRIPGRSPNVLFSRLAPHTRIPPHNGFLNTRLICHLPLVVPPDCGKLRCGNEARAWQEGELLIFDDSIEHEAWNEADAERVVLLFEIWRPELDAGERALVGALLELSAGYAE
jgi:aspartyl/asparaginyl beta-hydroxylase (cupin superfamily)